MSQHDAHKAVDYIRETAPLFAAAKAQRVYLEESRKSKKAILMSQAEGSIGAREMYAYSHPDYIALLDDLKKAVEAEEAMLWRLRGASMRVDVIRTLEASARAEGRATQ